MSQPNPYPDDVISLIHNAAKADIRVSFSGVAQEMFGDTKYDLRISVEAFRKGRIVKQDYILAAPQVGQLGVVLEGMINSVDSERSKL